MYIFLQCQSELWCRFMSHCTNGKPRAEQFALLCPEEHNRIITSITNEIGVLLTAVSFSTKLIHLVNKQRCVVEKICDHIIKGCIVVHIKRGD